MSVDSSLLILGFVAVLGQALTAGIIKSLLASNRSLTRALIAKTPHEAAILEQAAAINEPKPLRLPFSGQARPVDDDYPLTPLGL